MKIRYPSGSHASGETGRSTWMIGSNIRLNILLVPEQEPQRRADEQRDRVALGDEPERQQQ